ncbi:hypothetical protein C2845_PM08G10270 [Panicum miliaceum]|uniref:Uncharacterized protein n=1 Tax=Panicum miliaceum TaxID=4540 RepID=A0A3L6R3W4_PANMI|nr:hypothetical protein C2845_PM08G10270 [Panicum miliaceum]
MEVYVDRTVYPWVEPTAACFGCTVLNGARRDRKIVSLKEEAHLNTCFKHFILFTNEFGLIDKKELAPLQELIESSIVPY